mmetsp:Transcript_31041/g.95011  ORF Transcript_31041/g.95011 Transcript_31041/m.95011 type:complete len:83 (+) Transcript_31041:121-369(+)|eukprot:scaffold247427_cov36-Tisochrysis_lutea.AAC.1
MRIQQPVQCAASSSCARQAMRACTALFAHGSTESHTKASQSQHSTPPPLAEHLPSGDIGDNHMTVTYLGVGPTPRPRSEKVT